jgi:hypothetical protein
MSEQLTEVDALLLGRWTDVVGIREAVKDLEGRLGDRLEATAERLRAWLTGRGYVLLEVEARFASVNVGKEKWMRNPEEPLICIAVGGLFPFGYRRVEEEHPYVWLYSDGLTEEEQRMFQGEVSRRLENRPGGWLNEECRQDTPAGRYVTSHDDRERARLAQSDESLESFIRTELEPMLLLGDDFDAALETVRSAKRSKGKQQ